MGKKRKIFLYIAMSLDGYIARKNHDLEWLFKFNVPDEDYGYNEFIKNVDTIIMGRTTYDEVVKMGHEYPHGDKEYYILTHRVDASKKNLFFYNGDLRELVLNLKSKQGGDIYVDGSAVINELMKHHLIDEYIISIIPIFLGDGIRLFNDGRPEEQLQLIECEKFKTGLIQLHYKINSNTL